MQNTSSPHVDNKASPTYCCSVPPPISTQSQQDSVTFTCALHNWGKYTQQLHWIITDDRVTLYFFYLFKLWVLSDAPKWKRGCSLDVETAWFSEVGSVRSVLGRRSGSCVRLRQTVFRLNSETISPSLLWLCLFSTSRSWSLFRPQWTSLCSVCMDNSGLVKSSGCLWCVCAQSASGVCLLTSDEDIRCCLIVWKKTIYTEQDNPSQ